MKKVLVCFLLFIFNSAYASYVKVEVNASCVTLNQLLGDDYPQVDVLCGILPGDPKLVSIAIVQSKLKSMGLQATIDTPFIVERRGEQILPQQIEDVIKQTYENHYTGKIVEVSVKFPKDIFIAADSPYDIGMDVARTGTVQGSITTDSARSNFVYTVRIYQKVFVATQRISLGETLTDKVQVEKIATSTVRGNPVENIEGLVASKTILKGKTITEDTVKAMPDLKKGSKVKLLYISNNIQLEIEAVAEEDTSVGKTFLVKNPATDKVFYATYKGNGFAVMK